MAGLLGRTVVEAARRFGDRVAVVGPNGLGLTYQQLDQRSDEAAAWLGAQGLRAGDVVALVLPSSPEYLVLQCAASKAGVAHGGVNPRLSADERETALDVLGPALTVGTADLLSRDGVVIDVAEKEADVCRAVRRDGVSPDPRPRGADDPSAVVLTSGTTGRPRAAVFGDRQLDAIRRMDAGDEWGGGGPLLVSTELCHVGVATKLTWYLRRGSTLHLLRRWRAADALDVIERERVTSVGGISSQFALLLREPDFDDRDLDHVTALIAGGGPSSPGLIDEARRRFGAPYSVRYSSTESGGIGCGTAFDADDEEALHTVGRPRPGVDVRIGEDGRVLLRSDAVMARYHGDPDATAETLVDGWLRTSDVGHLDDRGCLVLEGRAADSWVRGGHNVFPEPVEAALSTHPLVAEVAVVPVLDDVMGHVGLAVVVPRDPGRPPALADLRSHAGGDLARWELPEAVHIIGDLPRTGVDKVDRRALRSLVHTAPTAGGRGGRGAST